MKNLLSLLAVLSMFIWATAYFMYHERGFIHIFLGISAITALMRIVVEVYYTKRLAAKRALVKAVK